MKTISVAHVRGMLNDAIEICCSNERYNEKIAGQLLAYKTEVERYHQDPFEQIELAEIIYNLLAIYDDTK